MICPTTSNTSPRASASLRSSSAWTPNAATTSSCGAPQLLVVAAFGVQADDERRLADARGEVFDVVGQIITAAFFTALDNEHAGGVRNTGGLQGCNGGQ